MIVIPIHVRMVEIAQTVSTVTVASVRQDSLELAARQVNKILIK